MSESLADQIESEQAAADKPADPAPRKRAAGRKRSTPKGRKTTSARGSAKSVQKPLESLFATVGALVSMGNPVDGAIILARAEETARRLDDIAKQSPSVHRVLSALTTGSSGWAGVATAVAPMLLPIAANHGVFASVPAVEEMALGMMPNEAHAMRQMMDAVKGADTSDTSS